LRRVATTCSNAGVPPTHRTLRVGSFSAVLMLGISSSAVAAGEPHHVQVTASAPAVACGELETSLTLLDFEGAPVEQDVNVKVCVSPSPDLEMRTSTLIADRFEAGCVEGLLRKGTATVLWRLGNVPGVTFEPFHPSLPGAPEPLQLTVDGHTEEATCEQLPGPDTRDEAVMGWSCSTVPASHLLGVLTVLGLRVRRRRQS